jgi:orotate phosphoribosyltransferase
VILLEDLISTGGSSIKCVKALKAEGAEEVEVLALFTYELRSAEAAFRDAGITLHTLATLTELEEKALKLGTIAETGHESLTAWRSDPEKWSKEHGG